jgi:N-acylneuraminate cytidylyltransferase/CMP-N,N'-diacetyllegionaminic acid synthase
MIDGKRVLGLITARGGSKGLPGKNVRLLRGQPLIVWTIAAARSSTSIDTLMVSTDDAAIAAIATAHGVEVPFMRPQELASDSATSMSAVTHALDWLLAAGRSFDYLVLLEPTSPLREREDIDNALAQMIAAGATSVVSVCRTEAAHPSYLYRRAADGTLSPMITGDGSPPRRQEIDDWYFLEGSVYASRVDTLRACGRFQQDHTLGYVVPKWKAIEIDDEIDLVIAEAIMRYRGLGQ